MNSPESTSPGGRSKGRSATKDMLPLRTYALLSEAAPKHIVFSQHLLRFEGLKLFSAGPDLVWGVQGTSAVNSADAYASRDAGFLKRSLFQVELMYRTRGLPPLGSPITEEFSLRSGYLHFSRLVKSYREVLRARFLEWLAQDSSENIAVLSALDFEDLVKSRPMLIHRLMAEMPALDIVIHPVLLAGGVSLRIATVRNKPENVARVYTRFHEEIETTM